MIKDTIDLPINTFVREIFFAHIFLHIYNPFLDAIYNQIRTAKTGKGTHFIFKGAPKGHKGCEVFKKDSRHLSCHHHYRKPAHSKKE
jgi:hypothetical protein